MKSGQIVALSVTIYPEFGESDRDARALAFSVHSRVWRNWQTRWLQVPVSARTWGFKSPLAHTSNPVLSTGFVRVVGTNEG